MCSECLVIQTGLGQKTYKDGCVLGHGEERPGSIPHAWTNFSKNAAVAFVPGFVILGDLWKLPMVDLQVCVGYTNTQTIIIPVTENLALYTCKTYKGFPGKY